MINVILQFRFFLVWIHQLVLLIYVLIKFIVRILSIFLKVPVGQGPPRASLSFVNWKGILRARCESWLFFWRRFPFSFWAARALLSGYRFLFFGFHIGWTGRRCTCSDCLTGFSVLAHGAGRPGVVNCVHRLIFWVWWLGAFLIAVPISWFLVLESSWYALVTLNSSALGSCSPTQCVGFVFISLRKRPESYGLSSQSLISISFCCLKRLLESDWLP